MNTTSALRKERARGHQQLARTSTPPICLHASRTDLVMLSDMAENNDLKRFVSASEPGTPAGEVTFVSRVPPISDRLMASLESSTQSRVLVLGQTGVGKSSELLALYRELYRKLYLPVMPPIDAALDLGEASWTEIFLYAALSGLSQLSPPRLETLPPALQSILGMGHTADLMTKMRSEALALRPRLAAAQGAAWDYACGVLARVEHMAQRKPVLLLDGLEKLAPAQARQLFLEQGRLIKQLPCRAVITAPLSIGSDVSFDDIASHFDGNTVRLRAFSPQTPMGYAQLAQIINRRGFGSGQEAQFIKLLEAFSALANGQPRQDSIQQGAHQLIMASGGLPRQLLQLASHAGKAAIGMGASTIVPLHVDIAVQQLSERFDYQLEPTDLDALRQPIGTLRVAQRDRLLQLGALIDYDPPQPQQRAELRPNPLLAGLLPVRV